MSRHLFIGSGGTTGRIMAQALASSGEPVCVTTRERTPASPVPGAIHAHWNFDDPERGVCEILEIIGKTPLGSLSLFAHPPFVRNSRPGEDPGILPALSTIDALVRLLTRLSPVLDTSSTLIFFLPSLSQHKASGYLAARAWIGAFTGIFEEWSRQHPGPRVTAIETLIAPDPDTPYLDAGMIQRISERTSRGRLATADEIAAFALFLIRSGTPLFHGQVLTTEGGPFF